MSPETPAAIDPGGCGRRWNTEACTGFGGEARCEADPGYTAIHNSKGLEFPLVAIMGGRIVERAKTDVELARLLYVGMTRATSELILTVGGAVE